jgi:hypothetical protein
MGIAVFIRPVIKVMTTAEFQSAAYLVPIICSHTWPKHGRGVPLRVRRH